jgi:hypothetical protein
MVIYCINLANKTFMKKLLLIMMLFSGAAEAGKEVLHGEVAQIASHCTAHFTRAETKYGIPKHLLLAIANTESGRYNHGLKMVLPWPWTLNIEGAGSYHSNMHDAITAVNRAKQQGKTSIDVGCMQVNLKHHPRAFTSVQDALTPARNVDYAASFLRSNFDELGSWPKAIAAYHSRSAKGGQYFAMVQKRWRDVRGIVGGNMLENTDYVAAKSELVNGVKVSRFIENSQFERSVIRRPSQFSISVNDGGKLTSNSNNQRINVKVNMGEAKVTSNTGMKVIRVSDSGLSRDNTTVTITPVALRTNSEQFVYNAKNTSQLASETTKVAEKPNPNTRNQPNFIFGR